FQKVLSIQKTFKEDEKKRLVEGYKAWTQSHASKPPMNKEPLLLQHENGHIYIYLLARNAVESYAEGGNLSSFFDNYFNPNVKKLSLQYQISDLDKLEESIGDELSKFKFCFC